MDKHIKKDFNSEKGHAQTVDCVESIYISFSGGEFFDIACEENVNSDDGHEN